MARSYIVADLGCVDTLGSTNYTMHFSITVIKSALTSTPQYFLNGSAGTNTSLYLAQLIASTSVCNPYIFKNGNSMTLTVADFYYD